jgi:hypothetical protein
MAVARSLTDRLDRFDHLYPDLRDRKRITSDLDKLFLKFKGSLDLGNRLASYSAEVFNDVRFSHYSLNTRYEFTLVAFRHANSLVPNNSSITGYIAQHTEDA